MPRARTRSTSPRSAPRADERLRTPEQALDLLRRTSILTLSPAKGVRSLVEEVVGEPVRGSWWGHPQGGTIYEIASALEAHPDVLTCKLVEGKVTFVHRVLFAPLLRVTTDASWHERGVAALSRASRGILQRVEREGTVALEESGLDSAARRTVKKELESRLLVHSVQEHTERGHHATLLVSWDRWAAARVSQAASRLSFDAAVDALAAAVPGLRAQLSGDRR